MLTRQYLFYKSQMTDDDSKQTLVRNRSWKARPFSFSFTSSKVLEEEWSKINCCMMIAILLYKKDRRMKRDEQRGQKRKLNLHYSKKQIEGRTYAPRNWYWTNFNLILKLAQTSQENNCRPQLLIYFIQFPCAAAMLFFKKWNDQRHTVHVPNRK